MNRLRTAGRPTAASRPVRGRVAAALATAAVLATLTGCGGWEYRENICGGGEYPVLSVGSTGQACVADGEEPEAGYARYPKGKVPEEVGDKWDVYWDTHTLDEDGRIVEVPAG
ncbi:SCO0607 family lipoprotein [Streptomyces sp. NPDC090106]|uniref:SCO0607 family lipoprotein n=1 Tax=Streptomyces sp. NPDC090106 TaxID=3365946 RepID=UPI0037FD87EE